MRQDKFSREKDPARLVYIMLRRGLDWSDEILAEVEELLKEKEFIKEEDKKNQIPL